MLLECLEPEGFDTISPKNGLIGVQRTQEQLPDLVICDIRMPQLDGYGVLTTLRTDPVERDDSPHFSHRKSNAVAIDHPQALWSINKFL